MWAQTRGRFKQNSVPELAGIKKNVRKKLEKKVGDFDSNYFSLRKMLIAKSPTKFHCIAF
jgi:hypothetical protein